MGDDKLKSNPGQQPDFIPVLPLKDVVIFPSVIVSIFVGREKSIRALDEVMKRQGQILLLTQKDTAQESPTKDDLFFIGTLGNILQVLKLPDGTVKVMLEGSARARAEDFDDNRAEYLAATYTLLEDVSVKTEDAQAYLRLLTEKFDSYIKLNKKSMPEELSSISDIKDLAKLSYTVASRLGGRLEEKQKILETKDVATRIELVLALMEQEIGVIHTEKRIRSRVKRQMEKTQREYYLNEQIKAIQKELGDAGAKDDVSDLEEQINKAGLPAKVKERARSELGKLKLMAPMSAESAVVRNYLDWIVSVPWVKKSPIKKDLDLVIDVLEEDHFGLEKVKDRIFEYLSVQKRTNSIIGPILCLEGPPGVGKTSLGRSIARATGRRFVRLSLGGVRDEAEIRGHRKTYIGAMPGKIIQSMRKAGTVNPLILLDEIDKMGVDFRGDPAAALLEVLDPEQNSQFSDHYLEVEYDLSKVMFVTTANSLDIPLPLLDRMEVISIKGYNEKEKVQIARRYLMRDARKEHGLTEDEWKVTDEALVKIIRNYTKEAGVRDFRRQINKLARKAVTRMFKNMRLKKIKVGVKELPTYLGVERYKVGMAEHEDQIGVVTGLAWTMRGGELLFVEAAVMPGTGEMSVTGNLKDVMVESMHAARAYVRSRADLLGIKPGVFKKNDIHLHLPEASVPKDGPSAGVSVVCAIVSVLTGIAVRKDVAMTGEITLRGRVLPVGGVEDKLLVAARSGIKTVLLPKGNESSLSEVDNETKKALKIVFVSHMDEVLQRALVKPLAKFSESGKAIDISPTNSLGDDVSVTAH